MKKSPAFDLSQLSYKQLVDLETRIADLKSEKRREEQDVLRDKLRKMAESAGFRLDTLFKTPRGGRRPSVDHGNSNVPVKYRDPKDPTNTWSGRGRPARWLAAYMKAGHKREEYLVR